MTSLLLQLPPKLGAKKAKNETHLNYREVVFLKAFSKHSKMRGVQSSAKFLVSG